MCLLTCSCACLAMSVFLLCRYSFGYAALVHAHTLTHLHTHAYTHTHTTVNMADIPSYMLSLVQHVPVHVYCMCTLLVQTLSLSLSLCCMHNHATVYSSAAIIIIIDRPHCHSANRAPHALCQTQPLNISPHTQNNQPTTPRFSK